MRHTTDARPRRPRSLPAAALLLTFAAGCGGGDDGAPPDDGSADRAGAPAEAPARSAASAGGDFEGVVTVRTFDEGESTVMTITVKGTNWRMDTEMEGERGSIIRTADGRLIALMHDERQYHVSTPPADGGDATTYVRLGESETVAGHRCEYYRMDEPGGPQDGDQVCVTTALGFVGVRSGGGVGDDERAIREQFRDGFMILKSRDAGGRVESEVTGIERRRVGDDAFEPPPGYSRLGVP
jgi:hypothetical protein